MQIFDKHTISLLLLTALSISVLSVYEGKAQTPVSGTQQQPILIENATIHIGNGTVIENGFLACSGGKITYCGTANGLTAADSAGAMRINAQGKHVYPGIIALHSTLGLTEIEAVRATRDFSEVGSYNPHIRSVIAFNTDSRIIPTIRTNGVLLAQVTPEGGIISGTSSLMELDGWNWEDAVRVTDDALYVSYPDMSLYAQFTQSSVEQRQKRIAKDIRELEQFFQEARAYCSAENPAVQNIRFEAMRPVFEGKRKVFVLANKAQDILSAIAFMKQFSIKPVIVGGADAWIIADFLRENAISVVITKTHRLPPRSGDDIHIQYKLPAMLKEKGVDFCLASSQSWQTRNLPFEAGTAAAWGLSKEEALRAITLSPAKILGVDKFLGSIESGKDATFFISEGDALDMRGNQVTSIFIRGRAVDTDNVQKQLYKKFLQKYNLSE